MSDDAEADAYLWLEDVQGEAALDWVRARNAETVHALTSGSAFGALVDEVREVLDDNGRIPYVTRRGEHLYNFWQDAEHVRGVWRRTTLEEYRTPEPRWEVLLDLDALAAAEDEKWAWAGSRVLPPAHRHALVLLSRDGADACVVREFDLGTKEFVADGFRVPEAKTRVSWIDRDHLYIGTDFGPDTLTASGYPRQVRRWRRGTPLSAAEPVHEVAAQDLSVTGWRDHTPGFERHFVSRAVDFWRSELFLLGPSGELRPVDVPQDAGAYAHREWLVVTPKSPWLGHPAGSLLAFRFEEFLAGGREAAVLFTPDDRTALAGHAWTRRHLIVRSLADVTSRLDVLTPGPDGWSREPLGELPPLTTALVTDTDEDESDEYFLAVTGFLQPAALYRGEVGTGHVVVKEAPPRFEADGMRVRQHFAVSADGTRVPYFVVGAEGGGPAPTLLYGYGGFEVSQLPRYSAVTGRAWLARGGTYAVANIRGGREYGPAWHRAALGADRPRAFEDFAAVAQDLVARGVTTPGELGIEGGSNGGLLMGAMLVRRPELFGAVVASVPLLDMLRFHKLLAGASWTAEYGDPDDPADREHLALLSPYHNAEAGRAYPPLLLLTSTRDDRVHPGHARKMAARLRDLGHRVYFHEHVGGGHGGATDHEQTAWNEALSHTFLWRHLAGPGQAAGA
ncbi:prolyl oligopeptidase family serine peptidase [Streptomyces sp. NPDC089919]|uniref:prolyl oligopeptidase family serine peptidase n=1 Tax=Streptomyces sp. NPDC089919 TaxID=3155188 RepID=UPI003436185C